MSVSKIWTRYIPPPLSPDYSHTHTEYKQIRLTVAPSRPSPEARTCKEPHRCGWSELLLVWESDKKKDIFLDLKTVYSSCGSLKLSEKAGEYEAGWQGAVSPRNISWKKRGMLTTHLQADSVFWISLLTFRRRKHWRDINTKTERERGKWKRKWERQYVREKERSRVEQGKGERQYVWGKERSCVKQRKEERVGRERGEKKRHTEREVLTEAKVVYCEVAAVQTEMIPCPGTKGGKSTGHTYTTSLVSCILC